MVKKRSKLLLALRVGIMSSLITTSVIAADKPNILVIWGDDIGQSNISSLYKRYDGL